MQMDYDLWSNIAAHCRHGEQMNSLSSRSMRARGGMQGAERVVWGSLTGMDLIGRLAGASSVRMHPASQRFPGVFREGRNEIHAAALVRGTHPTTLTGLVGSQNVTFGSAAVVSLACARSWGLLRAGSVRYQTSPREERPPPPEKDMFMVVKIAGKQHKVTIHDSVTTDKLIGKKVGDKIIINEVLLVGMKEGATWVGQPLVEGASVEAIVEQQTLGPKVYAFKKRRRKNSKRMRGYRASVTSLRIMELVPPPH